MGALGGLLFHDAVECHSNWPSQASNSLQSTIVSSSDSERSVELCEIFPKVLFRCLKHFGGTDRLAPDSLLGRYSTESDRMKSDHSSDQPPKDTRSSHARAMDRVTQITSISLSFAIPVLLGYYIDQWLGTGYLFLFLGLFFGMAAAAVQFRKLLISLERETNKHQRSS